MKLSNSDSDKLLIQSKLNNMKQVPAIFSLGVFSSSVKFMSFSTRDYNGNITSIDMDSGYVEWVNERGLRMPVVNINCIELLES